MEHVGRLRVLGMLVVTAALGSGCGHFLMASGAEVAASGMQSGTRQVAQGGSPSTDAVATAALGVGMMAAGYTLTDPSKRHPQPAPQGQWLYMPQPTTPPPPARPGMLP